MSNFCKKRLTFETQQRKVFFFHRRPALGSVSGGDQQICLATKGKSFCEEIQEKPFKTSESDQVEKVGFILFLCPAPVPFRYPAPGLTSKKRRGWMRQKDLNSLAKKKKKNQKCSLGFSCLSSDTLSKLNGSLRAVGILLIPLLKWRHQVLFTSKLWLRKCFQLTSFYIKQKHK